jgi:hypothetical protein
VHEVPEVSGGGGGLFLVGNIADTSPSGQSLPTIRR